eukprot:909359-Pleurochrysis_carterae.AAC.1
MERLPAATRTAAEGEGSWGEPVRKLEVGRCRGHDVAQATQLSRCSAGGGGSGGGGGGGVGSGAVGVGCVGGRLLLVCGAVDSVVAVAVSTVVVVCLVVRVALVRRVRRRRDTLRRGRSRGPCAVVASEGDGERGRRASGGGGG